MGKINISVSVCAGVWVCVGVCVSECITGVGIILTFKFLHSRVCLRIPSVCLSDLSCSDLGVRLRHEASFSFIITSRVVRCGVSMLIHSLPTY